MQEREEEKAATKKNPLAACPFCLDDHPVEMEIDSQLWAVCCFGCGTIGPHATNRGAAIARWGARGLPFATRNT